MEPPLPTLDLPSCELPAIQELSQRQQWVCWQSVKRDGRKATKLPLSPNTERPASTTDKGTWGSFSQAGQLFVTGEGIAGIGFVLSDSDPYVAIDLDNCVDPKTKEIEPKMLELAHSLESYTEYSPSMTGLHIFTRGIIPERGRRHGNVEVYASARYLTVTGWHVEGFPQDIHGSQDALTALFASFPKRKRAMPTGEAGYDLDKEPPGEKFAALLLNSAKFKNTWEHKRPDLTDQSMSSYDLSLASQAGLAEWTDQEIVSLIIAHRKDQGSTDKIERQDYFSRTIARARSNISYNISEKDAGAHASLGDAMDAGGEDAMTELSSRLNAPIVAVIKRGKDPAFYYLRLTTGDEIRIGEGKALNSQIAARTAIMNTTRRVFRRMKAAMWDRVVELMLSVAEEESLADGDSAIDMACLILAYLDSRPAMDWDADEGILTHNLSFIKDGKVWIHASSFIEWASIARGRNFQRAELISKFRELKLTSHQHARRENDNLLGRYYWGVSLSDLQALAFPSEGFPEEEPDAEATPF